MSKLVWDQSGEKLYETGVSKCVLFDVNDDTATKAEDYGVNGVAWNGITGVTESPSGAEDTDFYADNIKYGSMKSAEKFGGTIKAYREIHDGSKDLVISGVKVAQQTRKPFGLVYRTEIGNDVEGNEHGYKIHFIYGGSAKPSSKDYATINDSPSAIEFSWEIDTTPVPVESLSSDVEQTVTNLKLKATSYITCDSTKLTARRLKAFMMQFGSYDPETILQATKEYVDSFNGNYAFMRTLKYFIMKNEVKPDADGKQHVEQTSDLATCIDNLGSNTSINFETGDLI